MVVDDDVDIRETLAEILRDDGHEVYEARDGVEALGVLDHTERPCLILLDLMMPRMSGQEFLAHLRQRPDADQLRVAILTASRVREIAEDDPLIAGYLVKPFDLRAVEGLVHRWCG